VPFIIVDNIVSINIMLRPMSAAEKSSCDTVAASLKEEFETALDN